MRRRRGWTAAARATGRRWRARTDPANLRAALWARSSLRLLRVDLKSAGTQSRVPPPPPLPARGLRGVEAVLRRMKATCLEESLVLQRWLVEHGEPYEVVIGVGAPGESFGAHAWLAGYRYDAQAQNFFELTRLPPPPSSAA